MKTILIVLLLTISLAIFGSCTIKCEAKYLTKKYHPAVPPTYYESETTGRQIITYGEAAYYENVWSNTYPLYITFYSGMELNKINQNNDYRNNLIIAVIRWQNGGQSEITLEKWITNLEVVTEKEIRFDSKGNSISSVAGYDKKNIYWNIVY